MKVKNAKTLPKVYFGLHMVKGVAEYREPEQKPYRILIGEEALKNMDTSFQGRPVYVRHVDEVDLENLQAEADGFVVRSFYNSADGNHWVEFMVVSDRGHEALRNGWKLSNAYIPKSFKNGGEWHGVPYVKEVTEGEYEHLAIVPNPRYAESVILTPDEFKAYNAEREIELKRLANSKEKGESSMSKLKFWNRKPADNAADLEHLSVTLPKSGKEMTITQLVNEMDEHHEKAKENMADEKAMVKMHDGTMCNVGEMMEKHKALHDAHEELKKKLDSKEGEHELEESEHEVDVEGDKKNKEDEDADAKKKALELAAHEDKELKEKKANEEKEAAEKKKANALHFESLKNARDTVIRDEPKFEMAEDQLARGRARYGSN